MTVLLHAALFLELIGGAAIFAAARGSGRQAGSFSIDPLGLKKVTSVHKHALLAGTSLQLMLLTSIQ
jgi:hypothetical protein